MFDVPAPTALEAPNSVEIAPTGPTASEEAPLTVAGLISRYSGIYGISSTTFYSVAECESGLDPLAFNPNDPGGARGVFQFLPGTWRKYAKSGQDVWNAADNVETAARMFAAGEARQWSCYNQIRNDL